MLYEQNESENKKIPYEYYYGHAAIGLCKAAIAYDKSKGSFFSLAYLRIKSEITHAPKTSISWKELSSVVERALNKYGFASA